MFYNKPTIYIYRKDGGYNTSYYAAYSTENKRFYYIQTGALAGNRNDLRYATEEEQQKLFDVIKENGYKWNPRTKTLEKLISNKFDITTFKPFDKVLVRCSELEIWHISLFEKYNRKYSKYPFVCLNGNKYSQCIPYKDNEHLLDTADNCDDYYKTW